MTSEAQHNTATTFYI